MGNPGAITPEKWKSLIFINTEKKKSLTAGLYFASTASKESAAMLCKIGKLAVLMLALQSR